MNPHFIGKFSDKGTLRKIPDDTSSLCAPNIIEIDIQYEYNSNRSSCFTWGSFYDLKKTSKDLKIPYSNNPAELLFKALSNGRYTSAENFYGEFTFIYINHKTVVIGRDIAGAGIPVYYNNNYFSSSTGNFRKIPGFIFSADTDQIINFLNLGTVMQPKTAINGIFQLPPGNILIFDGQKLSTNSYLSFKRYHALSGTLKISENEAADELERLHHRAVNRRIKDKKKISLLLSGGYDSGGNLAALRANYKGEATGYTIGFKDDQWSELPLAQILAKSFDIDLKSNLIDGSELVRLPEIVRFMDNPFNENGLMVNYSVMKMVSADKNDIILGGDGNDQIYATGVQELALHYFAKQIRITKLQKLLAKLASKIDTTNKLFTKIIFHNERILNVNSLSSFGFKNDELKRLLNLNNNQITTNISDISDTSDLNFSRFDELFVFNSFYKSLVHDGCNLIIHKASSMSRLFNQKLSFPYMDKDMIDFIWKLPREMRFSGTIKELAKGRGTGKYLHKKYLRHKLPSQITERKKQGGFAPLPVFFSDAKQRNMVFNIIRTGDMAKTLLNRIYLELLFKRYEKINSSKTIWFWHKQNMAFKIFNLLILSIWWDIHINNKNGILLQDFAD